MGDPGGLRNLEQLQEDDEGRRTARGLSPPRAGPGGAFAASAGLALGGRTSRPQSAKNDPLGELVSQRSRPAPSSTVRPTDLSPKDVTFPQMLSDDHNPPTALAAVRPSGSSHAAPETIPTQPPPPTDRLPVVPIPAQAVLEATPIVTHPRDALTKVASDADRRASPPSSDTWRRRATMAAIGSGLVFIHKPKLEAFADQLRARAQGVRP
jgi:hypothetical protein